MTYTASEMRETAAINDEKAATCRATCRPGAAEEYETTAAMLRQAADAMEGRKLDFLGQDFDAYMVQLCGAAPGSDPYWAVLGFLGLNEYRDRELGRTLARMLTAHCRAMQDKGEG